MAQIKFNDYIQFHMGVEAQVIVDGEILHQRTTITKSLLFDIVQQKQEYGREMIIKPILRPLADITEMELKACERLSGLTPEGTKRFQYKGQPIPKFVDGWKSFEPEVMLYLLKQFDLFGLIAAGTAIDKTFNEVK